MTVSAVDGSQDKSTSPGANTAGINGSLLSKLGNFKGLVAKKPKGDKAAA
jgi:hypothetical protein